MDEEKTGGGIDPISAIAGAIGSIFSFFGARQMEDNIQQSQLPPWMTFDNVRLQRDNTFLYIAIFLLIAILFMAWLTNRK